MAQGFAPSRTAVANRLAQRLQLNVQAQAGDVFQFFQRDGRDAKATLAFRRDQCIAHQPGNGFAQRTCAHAVMQLQMLYAQLVAGQVPPFNDVITQLCIGALDQVRDVPASPSTATGLSISKGDFMIILDIFTTNIPQKKGSHTLQGWCKQVKPLLRMIFGFIP